MWGREADMEGYLTVSQAARRLGRCDETVWDYIRSGRPPPCGLLWGTSSPGRRWRGCGG